MTNNEEKKCTDTGMFASCRRFCNSESKQAPDNKLKEIVNDDKESNKSCEMKELKKTECPENDNKETFNLGGEQNKDRKIKQSNKKEIETRKGNSNTKKEEKNEEKNEEKKEIVDQFFKKKKRKKKKYKKNEEREKEIVNDFFKKNPKKKKGGKKFKKKINSQSSTPGIEFCFGERKSDSYTKKYLDNYEEMTSEDKISILNNCKNKNIVGNFQLFLDELIPNLIILCDIERKNIKDKKDLLRLGIKESWGKLPKKFIDKYKNFENFYERTNNSNSKESYFLKFIEIVYQAYRKKIKDDLQNDEKNHVIIVYGCCGHGKTSILKILGCVLNFDNENDEKLNKLRVGHNPTQGTHGISEKITVTFGNIKISFLDVQGTRDAAKIKSDAQVIKELRNTNLEIDAILFVNKLSDGRFLEDQVWTFESLAYAFKDIGPEIFTKVIPIFSRVNDFFEEKLPKYKNYIEDEERKKRFIEEHYGKDAKVNIDYKPSDIPPLTYTGKKKEEKDIEFLTKWINDVEKKMNSNPYYSFNARKNSCLKYLKVQFDKFFELRDLWTDKQIGNKEEKKKKLWNILKENTVFSGYVEELKDSVGNDFRGTKIQAIPDLKLNPMLAGMFYTEAPIEKIQNLKERYKKIINSNGTIDENWANTVVQKILNVSSVALKINLAMMKSDFCEEDKNKKSKKVKNDLGQNPKEIPVDEKTKQKTKSGLKKATKNQDPNWKLDTIKKSAIKFIKENPLMLVGGVAGGAIAVGAAAAAPIVVVSAIVGAVLGWVSGCFF